jgi:hypothetical protein
LAAAADWGKADCLYRQVDKWRVRSEVEPDAIMIDYENADIAAIANNAKLYRRKVYLTRAKIMPGRDINRAARQRESGCGGLKGGARVRFAGRISTVLQDTDFSGALDSPSCRERWRGTDQESSS